MCAFQQVYRVRQSIVIHQVRHFGDRALGGLVAYGHGVAMRRSGNATPLPKEPGERDGAIAEVASATLSLVPRKDLAPENTS